MNHILLADHEIGADELALHLRREALEVTTVVSGARAVEAAVLQQPGLVVLNQMLDDRKGIQVLRRLRMEPKTRDIPVIMLTHPSLAGDRIASLETGADDCVDKPVSHRELLLRIRAILRRTQKVNAVDELRAGPFCLDRKNLAFYVGGQMLDLTVTEFKLISKFIEHPNVLYSRGELLNGVWGYYDDTTTRTVDTHIGRLREKLGELGNHIRTVRGQGYQLTVEPVLAA